MANTLVPQVWTPGSDYTLGVSESQIVLGRDGNDTLLTFNPGADRQDQRKVDILVSDLEVPRLEAQQPQPRRNWQNRFVLGDWQQPYYVDSQPSNFGLNQFAVILELEPNRDLIQLHGTPEDYLLEETSVADRVGTVIFWQEDTTSDLIAFLPGISGVSLADELFQFQGDTAPAAALEEKSQQLGSSGIDLSTSSAIDLSGNVYIAGATSGSLAGENAGAYDPVVTKYDRNGNQIWVRQFGSSNFDWVTDIATDNQDNFYLAGYTEGDLGSAKQAEVADVWVAKYDSEGNQISIEQFGTELINRTFGVDVDSEGNVYLSGYTIEETRNSQTDDSWVTKYDSNGDQQWFTEFGTRQYDEAYDLAIDNEGNIYSTGWTLGDLGGTNSGVYDVWVAKHDNNGQVQFIEQFGSEDYEFPWAIDTDSEGNIYVTGWTLGDLAGKNRGSYDVWVAKYSSTGDQEWIQQFGTTGDDGLFFGDLEVDSNDDLYLTGYTDENLGGTNAGSYDVWVAKYNPQGDREWIQQFGTSALDYAHDLSVDNASRLYVTGMTEGSLGSINAGSADSWVAQLDADSGTLQDFTGDSEPILITSELTNVADPLLTRERQDFLSNNPTLAETFEREITQAISQTLLDFSDSNELLGFAQLANF